MRPTLDKEMEAEEAAEIVGDYLTYQLEGLKEYLARLERRYQRKPSGSLRKDIYRYEVAVDFCGALLDSLVDTK